MFLEYDFYKGKKILITGHTGFKGSWLTIWLRKLGAIVHGYALSPYTTKDNYVVSNLSDKIEETISDIRDKNRLKEVFNNFKPEIVFHLAAQPIVKTSFIDPKETFDVNVMGTVNVLQCIKETNSVKSAVIVTTDKCYENKNWSWGYRENDTLGGNDPYSASKSCCELVVNSYNSSFFSENLASRVSTVRGGNVIGGGDWQSYRLLPDCFRFLENNEKILIRNPEHVRPWQFVLELLYGYMLIAEKQYYDSFYVGAWNFGPQNNIICKVENIVKNVIKLYGSGEYCIDKSFCKNKESSFLVLDSSKAYKYLKWNNILSLDNALKLTVDWYLEYKNNEMLNFDEKQIEYYEKLIFEKSKEKNV